MQRELRVGARGPEDQLRGAGGIAAGDEPVASRRLVETNETRADDPLEMRVGKPIPTAGLSLRDLEALSAKVQKELEQLYYADRS